MKHLILITISLFSTLAIATQDIPEATELEKAYLGVAKALAESHDTHGACGPVEAYTSDIVDATRKARWAHDSNWEYNQATGDKFTIDPVVTKVLASTLALKDIMNMLDYNDPATFEHSLKRVVMWGPAPGAYGNMSYIKFKKNNEVELGSLELLDNDPWVQWNTSAGSYSVRADGWEMVVDITTASGTTSYILKQHYDWIPQWVLVPLNSPDANPYMDGYTDYPSECEA